ncbi:MAG: hypothetical protein OXU42_07620 [Deltaproteobacteria bacterium]|nr:hypothetical protein [Deltaproteobacteria bacterium]
MVRIVLSVLCLVALAFPAGAHYIGFPHTHEQRRPSVGDIWGQRLQQERREWQQQRNYERDRYYNPRYNNTLTTFDCLGENFRSCQGLPPRR